MADKTKFIEELNAKYQPKGEYIVLGKGMLDGEVIPEVDVNIPLKPLTDTVLLLELQERENQNATGFCRTTFAQRNSSLVMDIKETFLELR
jgi:hypothetical protein